jgi:hypothetical protein
MQSLLSDQVRLLVLVGLCGLLWSVESIAPLYRYQNSRARHALPNVALTLILVLTNLALSFSSAYLAGLTVLGHPDPLVGFHRVRCRLNEQMG